MIYNRVNIFTCKFFHLNQDKKLQFSRGRFKGRTSLDFDKIDEIQKVIAYCFWIINKEDTSLVSKYTASSFIKDMTSQIKDIEKKIREKVIAKQEKDKKETEESINTVGSKYGK